VKPFDHPQHVRSGAWPRSTGSAPETSRVPAARTRSEPRGGRSSSNSAAWRQHQQTLAELKRRDFARETAIPREERLRMHTLRIRSHAEFVAGTETYDEVSTEGLET